jgi:hypothetical protein
MWYRFHLIEFVCWDSKDGGAPPVEDEALSRDDEYL